MEPIFNEKVAEKWYLWDHEQCCGIHWCDKSDEKVEKCGYCSWTVAAVPYCCWQKKKKKKEEKTQHKTQTWDSLLTKQVHCICCSRSYKASPEKHKDDLRWSRDTRNPYKCMNVMKQDAMQNMWKTMHARGSWQIEICVENLSRSYPEISMDQEFIENILSRQRAQKFGLMDRPSCQEAIEV